MHIQANLITPVGENRLIDLSAEAKEFPCWYVARPNKSAGSHCFCIQLGANKGISIYSALPGSGTRAEKYTAPRQSDAREFASRDRALRTEQDAIYRGGLFAAKIGNPLLSSECISTPAHAWLRQWWIAMHALGFSHGWLRKLGQTRVTISFWVCASDSGGNFSLSESISFQSRRWSVICFDTSKSRFARNAINSKHI